MRHMYQPCSTSAVLRTAGHCPITIHVGTLCYASQEPLCPYARCCGESASPIGQSLTLDAACCCCCCASASCLFQVDLSHLRLLSCGGSPQSRAVIARAIASFGCEFFVSYGMTECCGKISMSILPAYWPQQLQQLLQQAGGAGNVRAQQAAAQFYEALLGKVCTSGRPFLLMEVRFLCLCCRVPTPVCAADNISLHVNIT